MLDKTDRILVTGGAGFIGSHLVYELLNQGFKVRVLEKPGVNIKHLPENNLEIIRADITERENLKNAVSGCSIVFHLAADPNLWRKSRSNYHVVNYIGARNVIETALEMGVKKIVHASTESILTLKNQSDEITENQRVGIKDSIGSYCRSKMRAELFALGLGSMGAPVIVVNPTLPVGPGDHGLSPPSRMIVDFCKSGRREYIKGDLNLADVRDIAKGFILACEKGVPGRRYILSGENKSIREVFQILSKIVTVPGPDIQIPYSIALAFAFFSELWADLVTGLPPQANLTGVQLTRRIMHFKSNVSLKEMGWKVRPIINSLEDSVTWFKSCGLL